MAASTTRRASTLRSIVLLSLAAAAVPGALRAQDIWDDWYNPYAGQPRSLSIGVMGGTYWSTPWSDLVVLGSISSRGAVEQVLLRQVQVSPGALFGGSITYRRGRGGARLQAAYSRSCLEIAGSCNPASFATGSQIPQPQRINVRTWMADVDGEISLVEARSGQWARPYLLLGAGGIVYDPDGSAAQLLPQFLEFGGGSARVDGSEVTVSFPDAGQIVADVQGAGLQTVFSLVVGAGTDLRVPVGNGGFGIRLQVADHMAASPMKVRVVGGRFGQPTDLGFGAIHNLRLTAGAVIDFDLGRVKRVALHGD